MECVRKTELYAKWRVRCVKQKSGELRKSTYGDRVILRCSIARSLYGCGLTVPSQVEMVVMLTRIIASSKEQKLRTPE